MNEFKEAFKPQASFEGTYRFNIEGYTKPLIVDVKTTDLDVCYKETDLVDVTVQITENVLSGIVAGRMSFQRAFMAGDMTMKGDFGLLRTLDQIFMFTK